MLNKRLLFSPLVFLLIISVFATSQPEIAYAEDSPVTTIIPSGTNQIENILDRHNDTEVQKAGGICYILRKFKDESSSLNNTGVSLGNTQYNSYNRNITLGDLIKYGCVGLQDIPLLIVYIINFLLGIIGSVCVIMIIYGGYQYVLGGFTEKGIKGAGETIKYAIIGLIIALMSWIIINFILTNLII